MSRDANLLPPFIPPATLARWATGCLLASAGLAWIAVGVDLSALRLLFGGSDGAAVEEATRWAQRTTTSWLFGARLACLVVTAIAFLAWLYQARVNVRALGARRLRYERSWTLLGFLVPVLNVFRPYQVMREIWQASDPEVENAFAWKTAPVPPLLRCWWALFVGWAALLTLTGLSELGAGANLAKIQLSVGLQLLTDLIAGLAASLTCFVVLRLSETQQRKHDLQRLGEADTSDPAAAPTLWQPLSTPESERVS